GLDARSIPAIKLRIPDLMQLASHIVEQTNTHRPKAVFIDVTGSGYGVHDRLAQLGCEGLIGVNFASSADRDEGRSDANARYANKRAEMWGFMRDWCRTGCLPDDRDLSADLTGVEYGYNNKDE